MLILLKKYISIICLKICKYYIFVLIFYIIFVLLSNIHLSSC